VNNQHRTHNNVGKSDANLGEYFSDVVKVDVVEVNCVDTAGCLETPATIECIQRPTAIQLQSVAFDLRQTFCVLVGCVAVKASYARHLKPISQVWLDYRRLRVSTIYIGDIYRWYILDIYPILSSSKISDIFDIFKIGYSPYFSTLLYYLM